MPRLRRQLILPILTRALKEDLGPGDLTSQALVNPTLRVQAVIVAHHRGVLAGFPVIVWLFQLLDPEVRLVRGLKEGARFRRGQPVALWEGPARALLAGERVALNLLSQLSSIATVTAHFKRKLRRYPHMQLLDTRKTTPGLRVLEKYAVRVGGGVNHRLGLFDQVLVKDNHWVILRAERDSVLQRLTHLVQRAHRIKVPVIIEAKTLKEFQLALRAQPDVILLDNMSIPLVRRCVAIRNRTGLTPLLEASGGVSLATLSRIAATGIDRISVGALTETGRTVDFSLEVKKLLPRPYTPRSRD